MRGLLMIVYTVITSYFIGIFITLPMYLFGLFTPFKKFSKDFCLYSQHIMMNNISCFYQDILGLPLYLYGDKIENKGSNIFIMNHRSSLDFLYLISLLTHTTDPEKIKYVMKSELKYIPSLGWLTFINDFPLLERKYETDKKCLNNIGKMEDEVNILIFPEGTRFSKQKLEDSNKYSIANNYPQFFNVLLPKSKGLHNIFVSMMDNNKLTNIYDLTIKYDGINIKDAHTASDVIFKDDIKSIHVLSRKIDLSELSYNQEKFKFWLHKLFLEKDIILQSNIESWKKSYPYKKLNKKINYIWLLLVIIYTLCCIILLFKSKSFKYYNLIIIILGSIIVYKNIGKEKSSKKIKDKKILVLNC